VVVLVASAVFVPTAGAQDDSDADSNAADDELSTEGLVTLDSVHSGSLLLVSDRPGLYVPAPALKTTIDVAVSGPLARTVVSQRFENRADVFVEGRYVFPLPEGAAVDTLRMQVGDRWIEGVIEGREEAKQIYEAAREEGRVTSLVEQQRPNVFTTSVANIAPRADVIVQIEYQQSLAPHNGVFGLRVPLLVAPRYVAEGQLTEVVSLSSDGWGIETQIDDDASFALSSQAPPDENYESAVRNPVELSVDLDAGFPIDDVQSLYHEVDIDRRTDSSVQVDLAGEVPADRDFYLSWKPGSLTKPYGAVFGERIEGETHYIAMLTPPSANARTAVGAAREVILVQDTSGSMSGESIEQAKAGLAAALRALREDDTFNVIEFNSEHTIFSDEPVRATPANIRRALGFIDGLVADRGTEMKPALARALRDGNRDDDRLRQVIFLTDGLVTNEVELLKLIEEDLGRSRLFTVGIGSAPNSYFMSAAAQSGRGSSVFIGAIDEVDEQMRVLFAKIGTPAIVDLALDQLPSGVEVSPSPIPDLYVGDPIVLTVRVPDGDDLETLRVQGRRDERAWRLDLSLEDVESRPGVSKLWAREHIRDLETSRRAPTLSTRQLDAIDDSILEVALDFGLVSRLTSLVAVDVEVTRPDEAESGSAGVLLNPPAGWDPAIFSAADSAAATPDDGGNHGALVDPIDPVAQDEAPQVPRLAYGPRSQPDTTMHAGPNLGPTQPTARSAHVPLAATGADWKLTSVLGSALVAAGLATFGRRRTRP